MEVFRRRPSVRRNAVWLIPLCVLVLIFANDVDSLSVALYLTHSASMRSLAHLDQRGGALSAEEQVRREKWERVELPGEENLTVYFTEKRTDPWTRWLPLIRCGTTKISRPYFVVRDDVRIASGEVAWTINQTLIGLVSAREYFRRATPDSKGFLEDVKDGLPPPAKR